jgi:hypothetical protein
MYFNAKSILNKRDELMIRIGLEKPGIIGVTETWLNESIDDSVIAIPGFKICRRDRSDSSKTRGGGVLFYVKEDIQIEVI